MPPLPPDPALGLFETLLVVDGKPVEVEAHLGRLAASLGALYGTELPAAAAPALAEAAAGIALGRVRLAVAAGPEPRCEAAAEPIEARILFPGRGRELRSLAVPGGIGCHKWADRAALPADEGEATALLLDADGAVLEAACANVFAARGQVLMTPPLDGRILPGVTRAATLALAAAAGIEVEERPLGREDLLAAEEVFLTGSVRGIEPARSLDGEALGAGRELTGRLSARLRQRWGLAAGASRASGRAAARPRAAAP